MTQEAIAIVSAEERPKVVDFEAYRSENRIVETRHSLATPEPLKPSSSTAVVPRESLLLVQQALAELVKQASWGSLATPTSTTVNLDLGSESVPTRGEGHLLMQVMTAQRVHLEQPRVVLAYVDVDDVAGRMLEDAAALLRQRLGDKVYLTARLEQNDWGNDRFLQLVIRQPAYDNDDELFDAIEDVSDQVYQKYQAGPSHLLITTDFVPS